MAEIMWHRRETRRPRENTNVSLTDGKDPAYSPFTESTGTDADWRETLRPPFDRNDLAKPGRFCVGQSAPIVAIILL